MLTAALFGVDQHSGAIPASISKMPSFFHWAWSIVHSSRSIGPAIPSTWSLLISFCAAAAICDGWVWSVCWESWIGCPLTPPLAFTQAKYAASMLEMSVKSVPGCLVLIEPRLIGVPVAFTPGLGPQAEVLTVVPAVEVLPPGDVLPP